MKKVLFILSLLSIKCFCSDDFARNTQNNKCEISKNLWQPDPGFDWVLEDGVWQYKRIFPVYYYSREILLEKRPSDLEESLDLEKKEVVQKIIENRVLEFLRKS